MEIWDKNMILGQIRFIPSYISQKQNNPINATKTISFGTQLVNIDNLKFTNHAKERMKERNISLEDIKKGIKEGKAYYEKTNTRVVILAKGNDGKSLFVVMDPTRTTVITVYHSNYDKYNSKFVITNDGTLLKSGYKFFPLSETHTPNRIETRNGGYKDVLIDGTVVKEHIITENGGYKDVLTDGTVVKERIITENGSYKDVMNGKVVKEYIVTENGYKEIGTDGKPMKVVVKDKNNQYYFYLPAEGIIKHRETRYTKDKPEFNTLKKKFFSEYK